MHIKVLSISDRISELVYSPAIRERFADVDLVLSCGDLPYYYVEFVVSALMKPVFFVRGNHANLMEESDTGQRSAPAGAMDLHRQALAYNGILLAGVEGSVRYKPGPFQYSQAQMWQYVLLMAPRLLYFKRRYGRALDIFVTHAPSWGIGDKSDWPHQGIRAFRWLVEVFKPAYHFHGHIHLYGANPQATIDYGATRVLNSYGYRVETITLPDYGSSVR